MSSTGLDVFDKTLQTTHIWLDELMQVIGPDRQVAWHVLGTVLRAIRDRVPIGLALANTRPVNVREATQAVFDLLSRHVNRGQVEKVRDAMPEEVRRLWTLSDEAPDRRERPERYTAQGDDGTANRTATGNEQRTGR
jgi:uncharacterized protein (DUF2267 family)